MALIYFSFSSILVDDAPSSSFHPSFGIIHEYPISPFLFVLMDKGICCILKTTITIQNIQVLNIHHSSAPLSHNQFVDDTMLMGVPSVKEARAFKTVIDDFMEASRTSINIISPKSSTSTPHS
jgi:hypothetical protein